MRKKIVAGNWKMNMDRAGAEALIAEIDDHVAALDTDAEMIVFPPAHLITQVAGQLNARVFVGAQNFYPAESGAFTGEISVTQVKDAGAAFVLVGHSERRSLFGEQSDFLRQKVDSALAHDLQVVFCCGEPLEIRESGTEVAYVQQQLSEALFHLDEQQLRQCIIAYEPVWAIGTGKTASSDQAEAMHAEIRSLLSEKYGSDFAESVSILYGGSCNPENAATLFACPNVDGGLIGGASLKAGQFLEIIKAV